MGQDSSNSARSEPDRKWPERKGDNGKVLCGLWFVGNSGACAGHQKSLRIPQGGGGRSKLEDIRRAAAQADRPRRADTGVTRKRIARRTENFASPRSTAAEI